MTIRGGAGIKLGEDKKVSPSFLRKTEQLDRTGCLIPGMDYVVVEVWLQNLFYNHTILLITIDDVRQ